MPRGRPTKPIHLVKGHRTKAEISVREKAEKRLLTGVSLKEWSDVKLNPIAHKEFMRLKRLLKKINHDDALHEGIFNRYCLLTAECKEFEQMKDKLINDLNEINEAYSNKEIDYMTLLQEKDKIQGRLFACDKKIMDKRKMMLDIEKENIMTIQSALRSIVKKEQPEEEGAMAKFLKQRNGNN